jgi:hypothetical protein
MDYMHNGAGGFIRELLNFDGTRVPRINSKNGNADEERASSAKEVLYALLDLAFRFTRSFLQGDRGHCQF